MSRFQIGVFLFGFSFLFVIAEVFTHPDIIQKAEIIIEKKEEAGEKKEETLTTNTNAQVLFEQVLPDQFFSVGLLEKEGITLHEGRYALALFQHVPVQAQRDSFYLASFVMKQNGKTLGTISRVLPINEMSAGRLFSLVRQKLEAAEAVNMQQEFSLSRPYDTIGKANFYLNDTINFPQTVFLVTRSDTKVLAFQGPSEYYDAVKNYIPLFFDNGEEGN